MKTQLLSGSETDLQRAAAIIQKGGLVAFPTETVYGLAADATNEQAVRAIYRVKGRDAGNPLIIHIASWNDATRYGVINEQQKLALRHFWVKEPSSVTFIVPFQSGVCSVALAGQKTIGLRVPHHACARALIDKAGVPLAAPSANISGRLSATSAFAVQQQLNGDINAIICDDAPLTHLTQWGIESTVCSLCDDVPLRLRMGAVNDDQLRAYFGAIRCYEEQPMSPHASPGLLGRHYSPSSSLRLNAPSCLPHEAGLSFGSSIMLGGRCEMNLSTQADLGEAARNLYEMLRILDEHGHIAVAPIPNEGWGRVINDRLRRAVQE